MGNFRTPGEYHHGQRNNIIHLSLNYYIINHHIHTLNNNHSHNIRCKCFLKLKLKNFNIQLQIKIVTQQW